MVQLIQINSAINLVQSAQWTIAPILPRLTIPKNTMSKVSLPLLDKHLTQTYNLASLAM